jgi:hypothetical protein
MRHIHGRLGTPCNAICMDGHGRGPTSTICHAWTMHDLNALMLNLEGDQRGHMLTPYIGTHYNV